MRMYSFFSLSPYYVCEWVGIQGTEPRVVLQLSCIHPQFFFFLFLFLILRQVLTKFLWLDSNLESYCLSFPSSWGHRRAPLQPQTVHFLNKSAFMLPSRVKTNVSGKQKFFLWYFSSKPHRAITCF